MKVFTSVTDSQVAAILLSGGIGILRTDTLYGFVARADDEQAVQRVYMVKDRDDAKSPIVLIDSTERLYDEPSPKVLTYLASVWPGPVSVILPSEKAPDWITRGNASVAYRMPGVDELRKLVATTGPLIVPSANPQGMEPATDIQTATEYFGDKVDFYVDSGSVTDMTPSKLVRIAPDGSIHRLR